MSANKPTTKPSLKTDWKRVDSLQDNDIDYSDIPELDDNFFKEAKVVMPHKKDSITLRIDHDVLNWFRQSGRNYQTRINAVLKAYYKAHLK